jgi:hypothetical protein
LGASAPVGGADTRVGAGASVCSRVRVISFKCFVCTKVCYIKTMRCAVLESAGE